MNKTEDYCCDVLRRAIMEGFIKKPGQRIPHRQVYSTKYFITTYDELGKRTLYMYIERCPNCGKALNKDKE